MIISSVRLGHATSSSSTHSILLNSKSPARLSANGEFQYGWDWFHIRDREGKAKYLAALIFSVLDREMAPEHAAIIARELTGYNPLNDRIFPGGDAFDPPVSYVDHQSVTSFPLAFDQKYYDPQFMAEFVECIRDDPRISIRGGNDNAEEHENWVEGDPHLVDALERDRGKERIYCRKDGSWWVLFNRDTGAKIRLSFAKNPSPYLKASAPELVDVKITNYCDRGGCRFCYQDSGRAGQHADPELLSSIAYACKEKKVFEVVLGGGEPTQHPQFVKILQAFGMYGISTSFTTYDMGWTRDKALVEGVLEYASAFAVSSPYCLREVSQWNGRDAGGILKGSLHIPLGCYDQKMLKRALVQADALGIPVTFLGFKKTGRGADFPVEDYKWILDYIANGDSWQRFGADSAFILEFGEELKARGISEKLMVNREGAFSCYIDAVDKKMGASSYAADLHELPKDRSACFSRFPYVP